jgi:hypothetical protein
VFNAALRQSLQARTYRSHSGSDDAVALLLDRIVRMPATYTSYPNGGPVLSATRQSA